MGSGSKGDPFGQTAGGEPVGSEGTDEGPQPGAGKGLRAGPTASHAEKASAWRWVGCIGQRSGAPGPSSRGAAWTTREVSLVTEETSSACTVLSLRCRRGFWTLTAVGNHGSSQPSSLLPPLALPYLGPSLFRHQSCSRPNSVQEGGFLLLP